MKQWAEALPSHTKTTGTLQDGIGNCCLGVACKLLKAYHPDTLREWEFDIQVHEDRIKIIDLELARKHTDFEDQADYVNTSTLPDRMSQKLGLVTDDIDTSIVNRLINLNDGAPSRNVRAHSFSEIGALLSDYADTGDPNPILEEANWTHRGHVPPTMPGYDE